MKAMSKIVLAIALCVSIASCQSNSDVSSILSKTDTRKAIMDTIANNSDMSKEMMAAMMNSKAGNMMMENHEAMMKMMKDNPGMMDNMMEACKTDTTMMSGMCKKMMENPQMMEMMHKMKGKNMDMDKMNAMDTTKTIQNKAHH